MSNVCAHLRISGIVQGVFFRVRTKEKAQELGLSGWVKNMPAGQVEAVIQGEKRIVENMIQWCRNGPPSARVTNVEIKWPPPTELTGFQIRY